MKLKRDKKKRSMETWQHYRNEERRGCKDKVWDIGIRILMTILGIGLMYIYFIVLTNVFHKLLFADSFCQGNVWGICGVKDLATGKKFELKSFAVAFLMVQFTLTSAIVATILLIVNYMEKNPNLYLEGRNRFCAYPKYVIAILLYSITIITFIFIIGIWGGRSLAITYIDNCKYYQNTHLGFYGCVDDKGDPIFDNLARCNRCCGVGLAMLGIPLSITVTLIFYIYKVVIRIWRDCRCHKRYLKEFENSEIVNHTKNKVERIDLGLCDVCNVRNISCTVFSCGHRVCLFCSFSHSNCPHCP